jgi:hypothetical protein
MIDDPIVEEIRAHRQAHAARFNYDLDAIFAAVVEREKSSSRQVINRPSRRIHEPLKAEILPLSIQPRITTAH